MKLKVIDIDEDTKLLVGAENLVVELYYHAGGIILTSATGYALHIKIPDTNVIFLSPDPK